MELLKNIIEGTWVVLAHMAPYLLLGFVVAGLLHIFLTAALVRRHMGRGGLWQIVKASLFGIPLPLCSCGVIPVAASLRSHGAGRGATASFLAATPQIGVNSILVTYGMLGPIFAAVRVVAAFISGVLSGVGVEWTAEGSSETAPAEAEAPQNSTEPPPPAWRRFFKHGFVTLPRDIGRAVLVGLLISGILGAVVPENFFADRLGQGFLSLVVMMVIGIPFYVCSTASIPVVLSLIHAGISPGGALVFLIAGPATNAATFTTLWTLIGRRGTLVYLTAIGISALTAGVAMDWVLPTAQVQEYVAACHTDPLALWQHASAVGMLVLLTVYRVPFWGRKRG